MYHKISQYIVDTLIEGNSIKHEERSLYLYCFETLLEMSINLITILLIGFILGRFPATLIFMFVFIPLRSTAGGYHCETSGKCYLLSITLFLAVVLSYEFVSYIPMLLIGVISIANFILVLIFSPVSSPNKPLSKKEKIRNRLASIILFLTFTVILLFMLKLKSAYAYVIFESITVSIISMIFGYVKFKKAT